MEIVTILMRREHVGLNVRNMRRNIFGDTNPKYKLIHYTGK